MPSELAHLSIGILIVVAIITVGLLITFLFRDGQRVRLSRQVLYEHCVKDGRPDYECYSLIYGRVR